jgi:hypothetical protein
VISREMAVQTLAVYETNIGFRLTDLPTGMRDHWDQNLRKMFADLGVDLDDAAQANAAFAGAYTIAALFGPVMVAPVTHLQNGVGIMRGLLEAADAAAGIRDFEAWLTQP